MFLFTCKHTCDLIIEDPECSASIDLFPELLKGVGKAIKREKIINRLRFPFDQQMESSYDLGVWGHPHLHVLADYKCDYVTTG